MLKDRQNLDMNDGAGAKMSRQREGGGSGLEPSYGFHRRTEGKQVLDLG